MDVELRPYLSDGGALNFHKIDDPDDNIFDPFAEPEEPGPLSCEGNARNRLIQITLVVLYFTIQTGIPLASTWSKHGKDDYPYRSAHVVSFAYMMAAFVGWSWHFYQYRKEAMAVLSWRQVLDYIPISLFDAGLEICRLNAMEQLLSATYVILSNLRLLVTSSLNRFFLRRKLTSFQIMALLFLVCGILLANSKRLQNFSVDGSFGVGLLFIAGYSACGGMSDTYSDRVLKRYQHQAVMAQYGIVCSFGVVMVFLTGCAFEKNMFSESYVKGFDGVTVLNVILVFLNVLISGSVVKYLDSMAKVLIQTAASMLVVFISIFGMGERDNLSFELIVGAIITFAAVIQYKLLKGDKRY